MAYDQPAHTRRAQVSFVIVLAVAAYLWIARESYDPTDSVTPGKVVQQHTGDLSNRGGSATVRRPHAKIDDDPSTSNDESNDQPLGHFGTLTLSVCNLQSGNCYPLDGELSGSTLERLYFPRGGWIDFLDCELDDDFNGECEDEDGKMWRIDGEY
jgi:hypothetical protein